MYFTHTIWKRIIYFNIFAQKLIILFIEKIGCFQRDILDHQVGNHQDDEFNGDGQVEG